MMGAENSGSTSTGASRSLYKPRTISAAAPTRTKERNCKLEPTIHRSMVKLPSDKLCRARRLFRSSTVPPTGHVFKVGYALRKVRHRTIGCSPEKGNEGA